MRRSEVFKTATARKAAVDLYRKLAASRDVVAKTGHTSNTNTAGGFLVDEELEATIQQIAERYGIFLSDARGYTMKGDLLRVPRRSGAATFHFTAQGETAAESALNYGQVNHTAKKPMGFVPISNELLQDSPEAAEDITLAAGQGFAQFVDDISFHGDGGEDHGGFTGLATFLQDGAHAGGIAAASGHNTLLEIDNTDLTNLVAALPARSAPGACWYCSHFAMAKVFFRLAAGGGGIGTNAAGEITYWGFPIRTTPTLPAVDTSLTSAAMLLFGDMRQSSSIAMRKGLTVEAAAFGLDWSFDMTKFRFRARFSVIHSDIGDATTVGAMTALIGTA